MRVALVHDWLTGTRGGEKVLLELVRMFPDAPVFTLFHFPGSQHPEIEARDIRTTFLQRVVSPRLDYRKLLPLFFAAAETWDLSGFDLVISTSHCVAKNAKRRAGAFHLCYCHTPVRYLHDQFDDYFRFRPAAVVAAARLARAPLRAWDVATARRVDAFLANSENVKERIARLWGRQAEVLAPPVDTEFFTPGPPSPRAGLLVVSALAPYKRLDDAVEAANARGLVLTIAGFGPERRRLEARAGETVRFADTPNDDMLRDLYRSAEAVLMPGEEDFGIVPLEAQACGTPVIALGRGGARETVRDGTTGVLVPEPGAAALLAGLDRLRSLRLDPGTAVENAARFSRAAFRTGFARALAAA
ncbi:MAG TPA: glycosyltransferase, partial [Thermoanaerobaculia bacterium]|nr:glycosyltransferase [Thermoanaerobaculia bacterium]